MTTCITVRMCKTEYQGPTDKHGPRVRAFHITTLKRVLVPWDCKLDDEQNQRKAAALLLGAEPHFRCGIDGGGYMFGVDPGKVGQ